MVVLPAGVCTLPARLRRVVDLPVLVRRCVPERNALSRSLWMYTMNRCSFLASLRVMACAFALACGFVATQAQGQQGVRQFPLAVERGILNVTAPPEVLIDGSAERLAPGVRIHGPTNMLVMSASLAGRTVAINYLRGGQGLVQEIWVLNQAELDEQRADFAPVTNFNFDSSASRPKTDDGKTPYDQLPKYPAKP